MEQKANDQITVIGYLRGLWGRGGGCSRLYKSVPPVLVSPEGEASLSC